jgi:metallo-beta-lactamase family protein
MAKSKSKIQIDFVGESSNDVTGSCIYIKTPNRQILLECGLFQSCGSTLENYKINNKHFEFKAKEIDYVFIMHNHADHICLTPKLYQQGCKAQIIAPSGTKPIAEILLRDSAHIMDTDALELSNKFKRDYCPIYTEDDVDKCLSYYTEHPIGDIIQLDEYIKFRFLPSGHILNSAQLELWVTEGNVTKKIGYTSDLGNIHIKKYYTNDFQPIKKCDVLICETTYAREERIANQKMRNKDLEKLETAIRQTCMENKSRVLIPVFANDRCQNMLTYLYDIFGLDESFDIPILIDSPMATRVCRAYGELLEGEELLKWKKVLSWKNICFVESSIDSRDWRESNQPVVVLASSGMMVRGRSTGWAHSMLPHTNDRIIFCGFAAEDSLAAIIKEGKQKSIIISGHRVKNKCQVTDLHSFSSHMQRDSLLKTYGATQCEKIVLIHGEMNGKILFAKDLQEEISKNNNTSKVVVANKGYSLSL